MKKKLGAALLTLANKLNPPTPVADPDQEQVETHLPPTGSERFFTSMLAGTLMTVFIIAVGASVSLFTHGISTSAFPVNLTTVSTSLAAWIFWGLICVVVIWALLTAKFSARKSGRERGNLELSLKKLDKAVVRLNTLPSEQFLPAYQDGYGSAFSAAMLAVLDPTAKVEAVEYAIRSVLAAIADTAKDFDGASASTVYGANIMLFRDRSEPPFDASTLHLVNVGPSHAGEYLGCLELIPSLSTSTAAPASRDERTVAIALPIPEDCEDFYDDGERVHKSPLLPGAPTAFVERAFDGFSSIERFLKKLHHKSSMDKRVIKRAQTYFTEGAGKHICSFASLPILDLAHAEEGKSTVALNAAGAEIEPAAGQAAEVTVPPPLGVVNIHSEDLGMLQDNGSSMFAPLMAPFLKLLAILLAKRRELLDQMPAPGGVSPGDGGTQGAMSPQCQLTETSPAAPQSSAEQPPLPRDQTTDRSTK